MNAHRLMPVAVLLLLALVAVFFAGCTTASPNGPSPGTQATLPANLNAKDCFFEVDDSAHSVSYGDIREITLTGHVSNICSIPMDKLTVRATFYDTAGKRLASAEGYAGRVAFHETIPFTLTADIPAEAGAFRYTLEPVFLQ